MFDIGFGELALVFVIGLVVLGPERLPVAVRTVSGWIRALRSLASTVQNELTQELKLQELQDSLKKVEKASKDSLSPELKASMEELREAAESMKKSYQDNEKQLDDEEYRTIGNPLATDDEAYHDGVTPAEGVSQAEAPPMKPEPVELAKKPANPPSEVKADPAIKADAQVCGPAAKPEQAEAPPAPGAASYTPEPDKQR